MPLYLLLEMDPAAKWMVISIAILTIVLTVSRPFFKKKDPLSRPPSFGSLAQHRSVERQMQNVLVDLSEMARQITAQLDTRAAKLEALIKEADQKIEMLKSAGGSPPAPMVFSQTPAPAQEREIAMLNPRHEQVYALADQGKTAPEIAHELDRPSGEIELIMALRR